MTHARRSRPSIEAESLESRHLLNAHLTQGLTVHVAASAPPGGGLISPTKPLVVSPVPKIAAPPKVHTPKAPHSLSGTVKGLSTYTLNPKNENQGYDVYSASSKVKAGVATYSGTDSFTSTLPNPTTFNDTYFNGFTVLTLPNNNNLSISYTGTGHSPVKSGPYSATLTGEAIGITGIYTGHQYAFKATLTGNEVDSSVTIKFTLKD